MVMISIVFWIWIPLWWHKCI